VKTYSQDLETANTLLEEAGWLLDGNGVRTASEIEGINNGTKFEVSLLYADHPQNSQTAGLIAEQLGACGIVVTANGMSDEALFSTGEGAPIFGRNFDLAYFSWQSSDEPPCQLFYSDAIPGPDEDIFPYKWGGWNPTGWGDEAYDAACQSAQGSAPGIEAYADNHALAQQILAEKLPVIPFFTRQQAVLARADICGLANDATAGVFWNVEEWGYGGVCP
jgi:peptide/nickel transport system substrate-binding protein